MLADQEHGVILVGDAAASRGPIARREATEMHVDVLKRITADRRSRSARLAAFASSRARDR